MNSLVNVESNLPVEIGELSKFVLVGEEKLNAVWAEIRAIKKLKLADAVLAQKQNEANELSKMVIYAQMRIGEMTAAMPKKAGRPSENSANPRQNFPTKADALDSAGINHRRASEYERMAAHPDIVERAMAEAQDNGDVVSRAGILKKVNAEIKRQERQESIRQQVEKPRASSHVDIYTTDRKYRVIYADPPWSYSDRQDTGMLGGAVKHYDTMPLEDICKLPVPAADDAVLFLWVTSPMLEDSFRVINAWGFKYKSSFVWDKVAHNMGHYNSVRHEFLLIATRGSCTPDVQRLFDSVVSIERTEHSRKPGQFREMIDTLYPIGERLELFAREASEGWDVWGDMV